MKVLLVHDYGTATGGAEVQMLRLRELLKERGHEARLFSSRASLIPAPVLADYSCAGTTSRLQVISRTVNVSAFWRLRQALRDFSPDVVHVRMFLWQLSPAILPLLRSVPCLYQSVTFNSVCPIGTKLLPDGSVCRHDAGWVCLQMKCLTPQSWVVLSFQQAFERLGRGVFREVAAQSRPMKDVLEQAGFRSVEIVPNGVPERPPRGRLEGVPVIGYAGRLAPEKGVFVLADALRELVRRGQNFRFLVAGDGPLRAQFLARLEEYGLSGRTEYLGHTTREAMEQRFDELWVQAAPSLWDEPFGNVATEAMMRGTAVVATGRGGFADIVEDGVCGFQVPPGDSDALAGALERLTSNRDLAERFGQAGRSRALAKYSEAACVESFLNLYRRMLETRDRP